MLVSYRDSMTMREARSAYFAANAFGDNGGYDDPWVDFKLRAEQTRDAGPATAGDWLAFLLATAAGLVVGLAVFALVLLFLPLGLWNQMRRAHARP